MGYGGTRAPDFYCGLPPDTPLEWAFPDQAGEDAAHSRKTKGDLKAAREKLCAWLAESPNPARLLAKLDDQRPGRLPSRLPGTGSGRPGPQPPGPKATGSARTQRCASPASPPRASPCR